MHAFSPRQLARLVRNQIYGLGAGDPIRTEALADLILDEPIMKGAIEKHMAEKQPQDGEIVGCVRNLLTSPVHMVLCVYNIFQFKKKRATILKFPATTYKSAHDQFSKRWYKMLPVLTMFRRS
jgi:hypothetical protein